MTPQPCGHPACCTGPITNIPADPRASASASYGCHCCAALAHCKDPRFDATDGACIAWWRGDDHGCAVTLQILGRALEGKDEWTGRGEQWAAMKRVAELVSERGALRERVGVLAAHIVLYAPDSPDVEWKP